jgi:hypothetical protein
MRSRNSKKTQKRYRNGGMRRGIDLGLSLNLEKANEEAKKRLKRDRSPSPVLDPSKPGDAKVIQIMKEIDDMLEFKSKPGYVPTEYSYPKFSEENKRREKEYLRINQQAFLSLFPDDTENVNVNGGYKKKSKSRKSRTRKSRTRKTRK